MPTDQCNERAVSLLTPKILKVPYVFAKKYSRNNPDLYDDILSECNYTLWRCALCYDPDRGVASFSTYVFRSCQLLMMRFIARKRRRSARLVALASDESIEAPPQRDHLAEREDLDQLLSCLKPREARLVEGKFVEERTYAELGKMTRTNKHTAHKRTKAARDKLVAAISA